MGKLADIAKKRNEERGFVPIELTERNVNIIFRKCSANENTDRNDIVMNWLFTKKGGFEENSGVFYMSKSELQKNRSYILYMLGQLYDIHITDDGFIYFKNFSINYKNEPWFQTSDSDEAYQTVCKLIALGTTALDERGAPLISTILKEFDGSIAADVMPTFSPKDPKFEEWSQSEKGKALLSKFHEMYENDKK